MKEYFGTPQSGGTAEGKLYLFTHGKSPVRRYHIENSTEEIKRFEKARTAAKKELEILFEKAVNEIGEEDARIFSTQIVMLYDDEITDSVYDLIVDQMVNAEIAVAQTCDMIMQEVGFVEDDYIGSRSYDVYDVCERVIRILLGAQAKEIRTDEPVIIVAKKLPPSDIVRFDRDKILGIVLEDNDEFSHAVVLAKSKGLPLIVGVENIINIAETGSHASLDGNKGVLKIY